MPSFQAMVERLNHLTTAEKLARYKAKNGPKLPPPENTLKLFAVTPYEREFAATFPPGLQAAIGAILNRNMERKVPLSVTWAWKPCYDFELALWECEDTSVSKGGITLLLGTRYPLDPHPGSIRKPKGKTRTKRKGS